MTARWSKICRRSHCVPGRLHQGQGNTRLLVLAEAQRNRSAPSSKANPCRRLRSPDKATVSPIQQKTALAAAVSREILIMADVQVTCITKPNRLSQHEGITHLGGPKWYWTRQEVIDSIRAKTNTFFTMSAGVRANIAVVEGQGGDYVRTHANGKWNDNLLSLPECGA